MSADVVQISVQGKSVAVPGMDFGRRVVLVRGKHLRIASIKDEFWTEEDPELGPEVLLRKCMEAGLQADLFTFTQKASDPDPRYDFPYEWDNVAAIRLKSYDDWWENQLSQVSRKNVRRSAKRGVVVRRAEFDEKFIEGVIGINNETPVRQGRKFWHYGKPAEIIRAEYGTFSDTSDFVGAYHGEELIGFIKVVYAGKFANILQCISKNAHYDKRPANAMVAKCVELAAARGATHVTYGKYIYGKNRRSPLTEFKRRNGFEMVNVPVYYVPLTMRGRVFARLRLHKGVKELLPEKLLYLLIDLRARLAERGLHKEQLANQSEQ